TSNSWQPEFGVQADFRASTKQDYATAPLLDQAYPEAGPALALYRMNPNKASYRIPVSPVYRVPLLYEYAVPGSQETVFTREVLYHDYGYFSSNAVGGYAEARIISMRLFRNFAAGLTWNMTYLKPLQSEFLTEDVAAELGGNQLYYSIKLSVFL